MVDEELQGSDEREFYLEKFRTFCNEETYFQAMVDHVTPREPLAVISHGDCWTNNFMFRYVNGDIAEVVYFQYSSFCFNYSSSFASGCSTLISKLNTYSLPLPILLNLLVILLNLLSVLLNLLSILLSLLPTLRKSRS